MNKGIYSYCVGLVDFPNKWAMTVFFSGCNMNCDFCHNKHILTEDPNYTLEDIIEIFEEARTITPNIGLVFSGGEPTINEDMWRMYEMYKGHVPLALHTNGLERPEECNAFDSVVLSLKDMWSLDKSDARIRAYWDKLLDTMFDLSGTEVKEIRYVQGTLSEAYLSMFKLHVEDELDGWNIVCVPNTLDP